MKGRKPEMTTKLVVTLLAVALILGSAIGGTVAWLTTQTQTLTNTFTVGNINITLAESDNLNLKMVPGCDITKDPKVAVTQGSEDCWLFVEVEPSGNFADFMTYIPADGWTALTGEMGVYYRQVLAADTAREFSVLKSDKVTVKEDVTKEMMDGLTPNTYPTLAFTAYACQMANGSGTFTEAQAWAKVKPSSP